MKKLTIFFAMLVLALSACTSQESKQKHGDIPMTTEEKEVYSAYEAINKAMIEIPPRFAGMAPVNPNSQEKQIKGLAPENRGANSLADDIQYYANQLKQEAINRVGKLYPKVNIPAEIGGAGYSNSLDMDKNRKMSKSILWM